MNLQQLEYILAVERTKNFAQAADQCFVTQPTLSAMIKKLEEEFGVIIFDRSTHPSTITDIGQVILDRSQEIIFQVQQLQQLVKDYKMGVSGNISIAIIPTVAAYLLPLFMEQLSEEYPNLILTIEEKTTQECLEALDRGTLDIAILATPIEGMKMTSHELYNEQFYLYAPKYSGRWKDGRVPFVEIPFDELLLLQEGHCMRSQVLSVCGSSYSFTSDRSTFKAGSIQTLVNMVDCGYGVTLLPESIFPYLTEDQQKGIFQLEEPYPMRQISLIHHPNYLRSKIIQAVVSTIQSCVKFESEGVVIPVT